LQIDFRNVDGSSSLEERDIVDVMPEVKALDLRFTDVSLDEMENLFYADDIGFVLMEDEFESFRSDGGVCADEAADGGGFSFDVVLEYGGVDE
jgi:transposase